MTTGKFRIESASNGTQYECDQKAWTGELLCARLLIYADYESMKYADTVAVSRDIQQQGWSIISGIMTVTEKQADHDNIFARLYGTHENMNVFYDDISIVPIPKSCQNLVLNGDFEVGDARFWLQGENYSKRTLDVEIFSLGANGSRYSLMLQNFSIERFGQRLDSRCLVEGQEFQISAKFRLLDVNNHASGIECDTSIRRNGSVSNNCPYVVIRGRECADDTVDNVYWNDNFQWDANDFNDFEKSFVVGPEMASCEDVRIEVGHRIQEGRVLLVDDIQISQRSTGALTLFPTFSPTREHSTNAQPVPYTDAPTNTNAFSCPPVGDASIDVTSGSVTLSRSDKICTLTKAVVFNDGKTSLIPIAISYDNNPWEQSAGEFAASVFASRGILCRAEGCEMYLPPLVRIGRFREAYLLKSYDHSLTPKEEYARFLETATFGVTQELLEEFEKSSTSAQDTITNWLSDQMDTSITPLTSHREFWRKGVNGRVSFDLLPFIVSLRCHIANFTSNMRPKAPIAYAPCKC